MATRKTNEERLQELDLRMEQLKKQKQTLLKREQDKERKERTRRLISNGALAEKYLGCEKLPPNEFEEVLKRIVSFEPVKNYISQNKNFTRSEE